ncbi:hypothetical protein [Streptomyces sp. WMMB 322]|uniref:hypothetical protein n=1 Tax=Streptomyces sp. WMMB 322 TaxID=1286821 RepID=UPI0011132082|nr:hypothetical protein [Streptomyces sp. WMMB 322]
MSQLLIVGAWLFYIVGFLMLLYVLEFFRSSRTLLRLVLCTACMIVSGAMLGIAALTEVPDFYSDTVLTRALDAASGVLAYLLAFTVLAVFVVAAVRSRPAFRSR